MLAGKHRGPCGNEPALARAVLTGERMRFRCRITVLSCVVRAPTAAELCVRVFGSLSSVSLLFVAPMNPQHPQFTDEPAGVFYCETATGNAVFDVNGCSFFTVQLCGRLSVRWGYRMTKSAVRID